MPLPSYMQKHEENCELCHKKMEISHSFLRETGDGVEVWYLCECGFKMGYVYFGGFIEAYKNAAKEVLSDSLPMHETPWPDLEKESA